MGCGCEALDGFAIETRDFDVELHLDAETGGEVIDRAVTARALQFLMKS